ncbi:MAG: TraR/DksA family transcriptional regulator [Bdellovibrionales bacterium]|nr:TraR/DksA family transcriptional regulator [Bdellovibrionales bacterium]
MNPKTALQLKKELVTKQKELLNLQKLNQKLEGEPESELKDMADRSDAEEAWFTKERMSQHWKHELSQINTALYKMDLGSFGVCEECDSDIPVKRLRVRPDAALCLNCQESMERELGPTQRIIRAPSPTAESLH